MKAGPTLACALHLVGCTFPEPFACTVDTDCQGGARCVAQRCQTPGDAASGEPDEGAAATDATPADAAAVTGPCTVVCPGGAPCEGLVPIVEPGFESATDAWLFEAPSRRTSAAIDRVSASVGQYLGEARIDWAEADGANTTQFSQRLSVSSLPPGAYRLCFQWRVATGNDNCETRTHLPEAHADVLAGEASQRVWSFDTDALCEGVDRSSGLWSTRWQEDCVDFDRATHWNAPGLVFGVSRSGDYARPSVHGLALDIDNVQLTAQACVQ